jgi:adenylate cyclase
VNVEDCVARGLYDPAAPNAPERLELLTWLTELGVTVEQMVTAEERGRLSGLAGDLAMRPGNRLTEEQVADRTGMTVNDIRELTLVVGLTPGATEGLGYTEADVELFEVFRAGALLFGDQPLKHFSRVIGSSLARIAEAAVSLFLGDVEVPLDEAGASELEKAKAQLDAITALNGLPALMDTLVRAHMEVAIQRNKAARADASSKTNVVIAVGFVDLAGFTRFSQRLPIGDLGAVIDEFEGTASDIVTTNGGRVVKLIGDEVMFVLVDAAAACETAIALCEQFGKRDPGLAPRGGVAIGESLMRGGDYYGPTVNLASRIAQLAVPNEILVTAEIQRRADRGREGALEFAPAGRRMLKGFDDPVELYSVGRPAR